MAGEVHGKRQSDKCPGPRANRSREQRLEFGRQILLHAGVKEEALASLSQILVPTKKERRLLLTISTGDSQRIC